MPRSKGKADEILRYVNQFILENGYAPSVREIGAAVDFRQQRHFLQFFFIHGTQGLFAGCRNGHHIKHALVVAVEHKAVFLGQVLRAVYLQVNISGGGGQLHNAADMLPLFFLRVFFCMLCIVAQLPVKAGELECVL